MPRIIYHLDFLLKNPDIKILVSFDYISNAIDCYHINQQVEATTDINIR